MKQRNVTTSVFVAASLSAVGIAVAAQDPLAQKSPNGISFSEFKGYEKWQVIASALSDNASGCGSAPEPGCIKSIVGNNVAIMAYEAGIPFNGKPVPDGATYVKIEWQKKHEVSPYGVTVPGNLTEVAFMVKDSKRFPDTNGWGYATLTYDATSGAWKPKGDNAAFGKAECHGCHTIVRANDYLFTHYPKR